MRFGVLRREAEGSFRARMASSAVSTLTVARLLIEIGWCQDASARTARGVKVRARSRKAVAFSALAAVLHVGGDYELEAYDFLQAAAFDPGCYPTRHYAALVSWNDEPGRTKEEVLALFDKAIAAAKQKEAS